MVKEKVESDQFSLSDAEVREIAKWNLDHLPWPFVVVSVPDYRCLYLNRSAGTVFRVAGYRDDDQPVGKHAEDVLDGWEETFKPAFEEVRLSGIVQQFGNIQYKMNRRTAYWDITLTPNCNASGQVISISCIAIESTQPRRVTRERERLATILEATSDFVITADLAGHVLYLNKSAREVFGIRDDADLGAMSLSRCHPDWAYQFTREESIPLAMRDGIWSGETTVLACDGRHIPVSQVIITHRTPDGAVDYFSMIARDISERKRAEHEHEELETHKLDFHRRMILAATDGKLMVTEREAIIGIVGQAEESWEIKKPDDFGRIRHRIRDLALTHGIDENRIHQFVMACGEALTNALQHGRGGEASFHALTDRLFLMVSDRGPGIEALNLPDVALTPGFSTAGTLGMGYKAMLSFTDKLYLATGPTGTTLALEMKR
ncbi:MAG TPA: PAS domain-containing protein, partial [Armatimonadota bacterium]